MTRTYVSTLYNNKLYMPTANVYNPSEDNLMLSLHLFRGTPWHSIGLNCKDWNVKFVWYRPKLNRRSYLGLVILVPDRTLRDIKARQNYLGWARASHKVDTRQKNNRSGKLNTGLIKVIIRPRNVEKHDQNIIKCNTCRNLPTRKFFWWLGLLLYPLLCPKWSENSRPICRQA